VKHPCYQQARIALTSLLALTFATFPNGASANTEPTAYDTRSVSMGQTGVSFLERPSAIAINPALLTGIEKFSFSVMFNPMFLNTCAPVQGPNTNMCTGVSFGPVGSTFFAWRITERMVWGAGIYVEAGYGATYDNVLNVDGEPDEVVGAEPQDQSVTFFSAEIATGPSIEINEKWSVGIMLRLPVAIQRADLYQNIGAASPVPNPTYGRIRNEIGGVGFPSVRIGLSFKPNDMWTIGAAWRAYTKVKMTGTTETGIDIPGLETLNAEADWVTPNALQFGSSVKLVDKKLLLATEVRIQFHGAKKQGNQTQTIIVSLPSGSNPALEDLLPDPTVAPLYWKNVYLLRLGLEYQVIDLLAIRFGFLVGNSNTREPFAQIFTPPPGITTSAQTGLGFSWDKVDFDLGMLFSQYGATIGPEVAEEPVEVNGELINVCSQDQVVRTGCAGDYKIRTFFFSTQLTYHY
jgi:long-subunit fatty acid transport protein